MREGTWIIPLLWWWIKCRWFLKFNLPGAVSGDLMKPCLIVCRDESTNPTNSSNTRVSVGFLKHLKPKTPKLTFLVLSKAKKFSYHMWKKAIKDNTYRKNVKKQNTQILVWAHPDFTLHLMITYNCKKNINTPYIYLLLRKNFIKKGYIYNFSLRE